MTSEPASSRCSRRAFLRAGAATTATAASVGTSGCLWVMGTRQQQIQAIRQQRQRVGGAPISFASQRDRVSKQQASHIVDTRSQLISAVGTQGAVVWVPGDVTIDVSGETKIKIANNVTIASNRNLKQATGGMIKTTDQKNSGVFTTKNETVDFRVTGVRLKGPRTDYFDPVAQGRDTYDYAVTGFRAYGSSVIVDNCEVLGWTGAGFTPGTKATPTQGWFHHNDMHHNQMAHLGYPMDLSNGQHLIEWNYFDANRHSIAGFGRAANAYEARFNVVGSNVDHPSFFQFDMHSLGENIESGPNANSNMAGKYVNIHHNLFELTEHNAFSISGDPKMHARFCQNWSADSKEPGGAGAVSPPPNRDLLQMKGNIFGSQVVSQGREWLKQLASQLGQRSTAVFPTKPSPSGFSIKLDITTSPTISGGSSTSMTTMTPDSKTPTNPQARRNPITGTALTPVDGGGI